MHCFMNPWTRCNRAMSEQASNAQCELLSTTPGAKLCVVCILFSSRTVPCNCSLLMAKHTACGYVYMLCSAAVHSSRKLSVSTMSKPGQCYLHKVRKACYVPSTQSGQTESMIHEWEHKWGGTRDLLRSYSPIHHSAETCRSFDHALGKLPGSATKHLVSESSLQETHADLLPMPRMQRISAQEGND